MNYTMKDVARVAGVSLGTVSNVLHNRPSVSSEYRDKVQRAMEQLNFSANYAAQVLKTKRTKSIGLIIPDISNPFYPEIARSVEDNAREAGYNLFLCNSDRDAVKEREYLESLIAKMVDGIILYKTQLPVDEINMIGERMCIVLVDPSMPIKNRDIVCVDDYAGIHMALQFLWEYQHRRIALIAGTPDSQSAIERVRAYQEFFIEKACPVSPNFIQYGYYDWHSGYVCANNLLKRLDVPTAILAANDLMAVGAMKALQERGVSIPHDISIMGYDDIDMATLCTPSLTTIRQPKYEMGECSVRALLKRINSPNEKNEYSSVTLKTEIIIRNSVTYCREVSKDGDL